MLVNVTRCAWSVIGKRERCSQVHLGHLHVLTSRAGETLAQLGAFSAGPGVGRCRGWHWKFGKLGAVHQTEGGHEHHVTFCEGGQSQFMKGISSWILSCSARMCVQHVMAPHQVRMSVEHILGWSRPTTTWKSSAVLPRWLAQGPGAFWKCSDWDG